MSKPTDIQVSAAEVHFLPVTMRVPLKFGPETVTNVVCLRLRVTVRDAKGLEAIGWGGTWITPYLYARQPACK